MRTVLLVGGGHAHVALLRRPALDARVVLVTPTMSSLYSGLLPAVIRRERTLASASLDLGAFAGVEVVLGTVKALDPVACVALLGTGQVVGFNLASLDPGGVSATVAGEIPAKPIGELPGHVEAIENGPSGTVALEGGGPAAVELALALADRWHGTRAVRLTAPTLLADAPAKARRALVAALKRSGVLLGPGPAVATIASGRTLGPPWLARSGLACDEAGCVRVDASLRSVSHPHVLAAGDAAAVDGEARPKGGVWAVRAGPTLAATLAALLAGREPPARPPQRSALTIVGLGGGRAVGWRGGVTLTGRLPYLLKDWLDRRWLAG